MAYVTAQSGLNTWGDQIKTSMHGRRCGLDNYDFGVGGPGSRDGIEVWTAGSTGAGTLSTAILHPGGISFLQATTASTFQMVGPAPTFLGVGKTIQFNSTAGQNMEIDLISGNFITTVSSTYTKITYTTTGTALNGSVYLQYISTALVALNGSTGAAGSGSTHIVFS